MNRPSRHRLPIPARPRVARTRRRVHGGGPARHRGVVLLLFVLVVALASTGLLLRALATAGNEAESAARLAARLALLEAGRAQLLGYAAVFVDERTAPVDTALPRPASPGYLPCPDGPNDADRSTDVACAPALAGFELGHWPIVVAEQPRVAELTHPDDAIVWFALSQNYRWPNRNIVLNSATPGQLTVDGTADVVALLIAPGEAVAGQSRVGAIAANQYLEGENADGDAVFGAGQGNDLVLAITRQDYWRALERRVLAAANAVVTCCRTDAFDCGNTQDAVPQPVCSLPWLAPWAVGNVAVDDPLATGTPPPPWFLANQWEDRIQSVAAGAALPGSDCNPALAPCLRVLL